MLRFRQQSCAIRSLCCAHKKNQVRVVIVSEKWNFRVGLIVAVTRQRKTEWPAQVTSHYYCCSNIITIVLQYYSINYSTKLYTRQKQPSRNLFRNSLGTTCKDDCSQEMMEPIPHLLKAF